jgi:hypothetical protein
MQSTAASRPRLIVGTPISLFTFVWESESFAWIGSESPVDSRFAAP